MVMTTLFKRNTLFILFIIFFTFPAQAIELSNDSKAPSVKATTKALGIYQAFGRWNRTLKLGYNPALAPGNMSSSHEFLTLIQEAASRWERVSGIDIEVLQAGSYRDDMHNSANSLDKVVSITWVSSVENFSGRVAPRLGQYDEGLGYYPYLDGAMTLNNRSNAWQSRTKALRTLTHEIGHLLGLGHSDNPSSMMFADPYNTLQYPATDDIRAAQALYGLPNNAIEADQPLSDWAYQPLPKSDPSFLAAVSISAEDTALPSHTITDSTREDGWLRVETPINNMRHSEPVATELELVMVDPNGYEYSRRMRSLTCAAGKYCRPWTGMIPLAVLKNLPGIWQVFINDPASQQLLRTMEFQVDTHPVFNLPPSARVVVARSDTANKIRVKVIAKDAEEDQISVTWNPLEIPEVLGSDGMSAWRTFELNYFGSKTFFIEVSDNATRYDGASETQTSGLGFRTLLRLDITYPLVGNEAILVTSSDLYAYQPGAPDLLTYYRLNAPDYQPSSIWPAPYNGVTPPAGKNVPVNNVAYLNAANATLFTCVRIVNNGNPDQIDGISQFDINFAIESFNDGTIRVTDARAFNAAGALNENFESPDCSGQYDLSTRTYSDWILINGQVFETEFWLRDPERLIYTLTAATATDLAE